MHTGCEDLILLALGCLLRGDTWSVDVAHHGRTDTEDINGGGGGARWVMSAMAMQTRMQMQMRLRKLAAVLCCGCWRWRRESLPEPWRASVCAEADLGLRCPLGKESRPRPAAQESVWRAIGMRTAARWGRGEDVAVIAVERRAEVEQMPELGLHWLAAARRRRQGRELQEAKAGPMQAGSAGQGRRRQQQQHLGPASASGLPAAPVEAMMSL